MLKQQIISHESEPHFLSFSLDTFGVTPLFFYENEREAIFSSHIQLIYARYPNLVGNPQAIFDLENDGYIRLGDTAFRDVKKLRGGTCIRVQVSRPDVEIWAPREPRPASAFVVADEPWCEHLCVLLKSAVIRGVESGIRYCALSGGSDSRLLLALMPPEMRREMIFYTKCNPEVGLKYDRDVIVAQKLARVAGITHFIVDRPENYFAFLVPENIETYVMSGLYGGEFLGGALLDIVPASIREPFETEGRSPHELARATIEASQAIFYNCKWRSWASPYAQFPFSYMPFLDEQVLKHLKLIDPYAYCSYGVYNQIWKLPFASEFSGIPFMSDLAKHQNYPLESEGQNPKTTQIRESLAEDTQDLVLANMEKYRVKLHSTPHQWPNF